jgi:hypothetical protein
MMQNLVSSLQNIQVKQLNQVIGINKVVSSAMNHFKNASYSLHAPFGVYFGGDRTVLVAILHQLLRTFCQIDVDG